MSEFSSFEEYKAVASQYPGMEVMTRLLTAANYESWVECINQVFDYVCDILSENPELKKDRSEDELTIDIINQLRHYPFSVAHEPKVGGHADIVIRGPHNRLWICEAKRHDKGYAWILKGFNQLTTRYSTGNAGQSAGALLIYTFQENTKRTLERWKDYLENNVEDIETSGCNDNTPLAFVSLLPHKRTGINFSVRHTPLSLYFKPEDR